MDVTISANYSDRPYALRMRIYTIENNAPANYSRYRGDRYAISLTSGTGSWAYDCRTYESWIAGYYLGGCYSLDFRPNFYGKTIGLGSYDTGAVYHDGNGNVSFTSRVRVYNVPAFGSADTGDVWMAGDRLPLAPGAPGIPTVSSLTPTSVTLSWTAAPRGHANITNYQWHMSTDPAFGSTVAAPTVGNILSDNTADNVTLLPGTIYYVRVRALNGDGWGPVSGTRQFTTLPATPPGMSVAPTVSGTGATATLTPPGGTTGVTKYTVEYRPLGSTAATTVDNPTSPIAVSDLTPGGIYEWRASAWFNTYQSPWTAWTSVVQPQPNTNPGDYFDGSSTPEPGADVTYAWTGAVNNSTSEAVGVGVDGWSLGAAITASGNVQRVTGGLFGAYAARLNINRDIADVTEELVTIGFSELEEGATYVASVYVNPSHENRLLLALRYTDDMGTIGTVMGEAQVVPGGEWTRLVVTAPAPAGALYGLIEVYAETGAGYSPLLGGDTILLDGAMISLGTVYPWFSGDTPDTAEFDYQWEGTPNQSVSARYVLTSVTPDLLADPDCPAPPAPPAVPTVPSDCILEIGTWRRYTIQLGELAVRKWTASLPTLVLSTGAAAERQVRIRYYPNPDSLPPELLDMSTWEAEQILTYIPPDSVVTLDGITQLVWATVGSSAPLPADKLLYGTDGLPATWPVLTCGAGYVITLDVPLDAPAGNLSSEIFITQRM